MSYILDALRKADAQRERDPARGIHAQPLQVSPLGPPEGHQVRLWLGGAVVIGAGLLAVAAWQLAGPAAPPVVLASTVGTPPAPAVTMPAPAPASPATEVLPAAPPPAPAPPVAPAATPLREARKPAPALAASSPAPAAAAPDRLLSVNELPADVQRDLPKLAISGGVYSDNAAQRMLIVNGQVVGEGAEPAPGVVLEQIRARTAVLRYRGYRYAVAY
ncbi:MAG: general secretion pathway protein GspB [Polaromonas sp.]|uniref:general secretion pathway protein GspB n=1 Tax=Polaromonas sp. TaxID=1869339 RepID=UPI0027335E39|nr:general secretion pathway protein GspB [Polaromonas sp.]MDP3796621.1 general secretion pathway protein GspB [Polaromonas sp.]